VAVYLRVEYIEAGNTVAEEFKAADFKAKHLRVDI